MRVPGIDRIAVVVPVHDEEVTLPACLKALVVAADAVDVPVALLVVLDSCTDRSATVAREFDELGVDVISIDAKNVGSARAAGMTELLERYGVTGTWLATTDGDSTVPFDWFSAQLRHAAKGARVVAGTVAVDDWVGRSDVVQELAQREYAATPGHVHGANLSFAAGAYRAVGGFAPVRCHEDVQLVEALRANGEPIAWATDLPVVTSARRQARAPLGFASYLTSLEFGRCRDRPRHDAVRPTVRQ